MGLFAALRDRLFGPPAAAPRPEEAPSQSAGSVEPVASADLREPASPEVSASDEMPRQADKRQPESAAVADEAVAARQERAASRLLEDESLRGDLTDDEFQPLLDWAMATADQLVASTAGLSDGRAERRIDGGLGAIREAVAAAADAVTAYANHDVDRLRKALSDAGIGARDQQADGAIARLMIAQGQSGPEVAALIAHRLGSVADTGSDRGSTAAHERSR
jgi:hypothetical protein